MLLHCPKLHRFANKKLRFQKVTHTVRKNFFKQRISRTKIGTFKTATSAPAPHRRGSVNASSNRNRPLVPLHLAPARTNTHLQDAMSISGRITKSFPGTNLRVRARLVISGGEKSDFAPTYEWSKLRTDCGELME
jgi:hypothetical protein